MFKSIKLLFAFVQSLLRSMLNLSSALEKASDELAHLAQDWQETNAINRNATRAKAQAKANKRLQKALLAINDGNDSKQAKETKAPSSGEEMTPDMLDELLNR